MDCQVVLRVILSLFCKLGLFARYAHFFSRRDTRRRDTVRKKHMFVVFGGYNDT